MIHSLQFLRFFAAALVVISHIRMEFDLALFGKHGVDVFFVISGFIIYHVTRDGSSYFFTRRLIRIVPLYWAGTIALGLAAIYFPSLLNNVQFDPMRFASSLLFFPNWNEAAGNFHPLLLLGWTLNYEMLFYFIFFLAMRISHRHRFAVASIILIALALSHPLAIEKSPQMFWSDSLALEFVFGMAIAVIARRTGFIDRARVPMVFAFAGLAAFCLLVHPMTGYVESEALRFLKVGLPSAALVALVLSCEASLRRQPQWLTRSIGFLGDLSYATYIFHVYVLGLLKRTVDLKIGIYLYSGLLFTVTYLAAAAIFLLVERPARTYLSRLFIRPQPPAPLMVPATVPAA
jgi:peptidoglycan/LPS O-acetylase OafA/YrhL